MYEDFLATDGTDVKVYTVGPDYAHAEARKSPVKPCDCHVICWCMMWLCHTMYTQALDGKVDRDEAGKEVRYPVILTAKEKLIARAVSLAFKVSKQVCC